jgi:hypothetical protein
VIGSDGGFLPTAAQLLGPAERADVILVLLAFAPSQCDGVRH